MLRLAVLGDSIGSGTGADHTCDTLGPRLVAHLAAADVPAEARVLAVPGARSTDLAAQVAHSAGWRPDVAVIVIGANDLTHLVPADAAAADLRAAVRGLRAIGAEVVLAPAPDLSAVPHVPRRRARWSGPSASGCGRRRSGSRWPRAAGSPMATV